MNEDEVRARGADVVDEMAKKLFARGVIRGIEAASADIPAAARRSVEAAERAMERENGPRIDWGHG